MGTLGPTPLGLMAVINHCRGCQNEASRLLPREPPWIVSCDPQRRLANRAAHEIFFCEGAPVCMARGSGHSFAGQYPARPRSRTTRSSGRDRREISAPSAALRMLRAPSPGTRRRCGHEAPRPIGAMWPERSTIWRGAPLGLLHEPNNDYATTMRGPFRVVRGRHSPRLFAARRQAGAGQLRGSEP